MCSCICVNLYSWTFVVIFKTRCDLVNEDLTNFFINLSRLKQGQLVSFSLTPLRCSVSQQLWTSWRPRYLLNVIKPSVPLEITVTLRGGQRAPNLFSQIFWKKSWAFVGSPLRFATDYVNDNHVCSSDVEQILLP